MPHPRNSWRRIQVLARSCLDCKLQQRGLRLLSKICKTNRIIPSSYILRWELVRIGWVYHRSRSAVVNNGEYLGCPVAIKHLTTDKADVDVMLKVPSINFTRYVTQLPTSGCIGRSSSGSICLMRTSRPSWGFSRPETCVACASSPSGCPTGT